MLWNPMGFFMAESLFPFPVLWNPVTSDEILGNPMDSYGISSWRILCSHFLSHAILCNPRKSYAILWNPMKSYGTFHHHRNHGSHFLSHGIPWDPMEAGGASMGAYDIFMVSNSIEKEQKKYHESDYISDLIATWKRVEFGHFRHFSFNLHTIFWHHFDTIFTPWKCHRTS